MLYALATGISTAPATVTPSATAIAQVRTNPVMREAAVETDMRAVERATEGGPAALAGSGTKGDPPAVSSLMSALRSPLGAPRAAVRHHSSGHRPVGPPPLPRCRVPVYSVAGDSPPRT
jgi:hypothetical protein